MKTIQSYEDFYRDQSLNVNRVGLVCAIVFSIIFFIYDEAIFGSELAPIVTYTRFFLIAPLFGVALFLSFRSPSPSTYLFMTALAFGITMACIGLFIAISPEQDLFVVFMMMNQMIALFIFVIFLPISLCILLLTTSIAVPIALLVALPNKPAYELIFLGAELLGICALSLAWALRRQKNIQQAYRSQMKLKNDTALRQRWNGSFREAINSQITQYLSEISQDLDQLCLVNPSNKYLQRALDALQNTKQLESKLLDSQRFFDQKRSDQQEVELASLLHKIKHDFQKQGENLALDSLPKSVYISADPILIYRAICNLVENALRHQKKGSTVALSLDEKGHLKITNEGEPPARTLSELAQPGEQDGDAPGRFGLGLHICSSICDANNIQLSYSHNKGFTSFSMQFPVIHLTEDPELENA
jgi:signal transduction histidine kinase